MESDTAESTAETAAATGAKPIHWMPPDPGMPPPARSRGTVRRGTARPALSNSMVPSQSKRRHGRRTRRGSGRNLSRAGGTRLALRNGRQSLLRRRFWTPTPRLTSKSISSAPSVHASPMTQQPMLQCFCATKSSRTLRPHRSEKRVLRQFYSQPELRDQAISWNGALDSTARSSRCTFEHMA